MDVPRQLKDLANGIGSESRYNEEVRALCVKIILLETFHIKPI